jgi:lysozyme
MELKKVSLCVAALTACSLCALPAGAMVQGIDVSTHQGAVNWNSVKAAGIQFAYTKATEGVDFVDNRFTQNMTNANAAGVLIGPYHYGRPDSNSSNPLDAFNEANDFVDAIQPYYNSAGLYLRPVLDVEEFLDLSTVAQERAYLSEWVRDFSDQVNSRLGVRPIIYCNGNYAQTYFEANIASHELWFAKPTSTNNYASASPPTDANMGIWSDWTFWQWTWTGSVGGINPVDRNSFAGEMVDLADYIVGFNQGDYNDDGVVNASDYTKWRDTLGQTVLPGRGADGNLNGVIDAGDFNVWKSKFGVAGAGGGAISVVPEPASLVTLLMAAASTSSLCSRLRRSDVCR